MPVTVRAIRTFAHEGRTVQKGDVLDLDRPLDAVLMARKGLISLSKVYRTAEVLPAPELLPEATRQKRRYRRRDMTAETT